MMGKYAKLYPTFINENSRSIKAIQNMQKEIPSSTNDIQLLQMMGKYYKPQPTFANENSKFGIAIQNSQNNTKSNK
jgi:hypothetical protein